MKFKKLSAVFLSLIMLVAFTIPLSVSAADPIPPTPTPNDGGEITAPVNPEPYIYSMDTTVFQAGDVIAVPIKLATIDGYADDVRMKLAGPEGKEAMFGFYESTGWLKVGNISGETDIKPYIQISPSLADGTYPVSVIFNYTRNGTPYTKTDKINLVVQGKSTTALYVKSANFAKAQIGKDNKSNLAVNIMNPTISAVSNVKVSFNTTASKGFSLYDNARSVTIPSIGSRASGTANFGVYVDSTVATGNYPLTIDMSYKDGTGTVVASNEVVYVQVTRTADAGADGKGSTPRIIVSKYSTDVKEIKAGQSFTLDFTLQNTSATVAVTNIKVVMGSVTTTGTGTGAGAQAGGAVFFAAEGSNSFFISKIESQGTATNKIKLMARQDVEPGVYPVLLKLDYEDAAGVAVPSSEEQISFAVTQEQRLDVQALTMPADAMMGSGIPLNFQYINKGKATIYNLSVTVEGDFTVEGGSQYIGNLTAGYNDFFDNVIMPSKEGSLKGEIVLKFENSNGDELEQRTPITCNVAPMMEGGEMGQPGMGGEIEPMPGQAKGGLSAILWIGIPLLVVIVGVLAFIIIMKKRRAKKVLVEDEED
ncbi:MAG: hypothetical protein WAX04_01770 [Oscillospiraceae bacterium]